PCVARNPTAYEQAGQKHGRTIPLPDIDGPAFLEGNADVPRESLGVLRSGLVGAWLAFPRSQRTKKDTVKDGVTAFTTD
ncbi:hypothetical protein, partial [Microvirga splendida]|uniref:hypothetical protein n=1 Tax=Microvirga splendida TaxID=2795727 RepID=UPI001AEDC88A